MKLKKEFCAGCIIINDNKVLLVHQINGNIWCFPKGHIEKGESKIDAAIREVKEETGLDVVADENVKFEVNYTYKNIDKTVYFYKASLASKQIKIGEDEIYSAGWFSYDEAINLLDYDSYKDILKSLKNLLRSGKIKMDRDFQSLYAKAKALTGKKELNKSISYAQVGCALLTDKGNVYTGVCVVAECGIGFCAEHSAIAEMLKHGESRIIKIVSTDKTGAIPPCGRCRELIKQLNYDNLDTKIMIGKKEIVTLRDLLPHMWIA